MERPIFEFLKYLIERCVREGEIDPDTTTVTEFLKAIDEIEGPMGF